MRRYHNSRKSGRYNEDKIVNMRRGKLYEDDEEIEIIGDEEEVDEIEEVLLEDKLAEIGDNLGYPFTSHSGRGSFSVSDNVEISVRFTPDEITAIDVRITKNPARFTCTKNTTTVDNLSVELQTCVMIVKDIRSKLNVRG